MNRAYIFDLDGTLVQTQTEFHAQAEVHVLQRYGIDLTPDSISERFAGVHTLDVFRELAPHADPFTLLEEKWKHMYEMTNSQEIVPVFYAEELVKELHAKGFRLGIASASPLEWIKLCLQKSNMEKYFAVLASADEVPNGKPAPDVFLLAARRLNVPTKHCIAIDDGRAGVAAGLAAGMETYWLSENRDEIMFSKKIRVLSELPSN